jgi:hypothetical protein
MALQLMAAAAHERHKSNLRAARWSVAALRQEPRVAVKAASDLVREKLAGGRRQ